MVIHNRATCVWCKVTFVKENETQTHCCRCQDDLKYKSISSELNKENGPYENRFCEYCGNYFRVQSAVPQKACSVACRNNLRSLKTAKEEQHKDIKQRQVKNANARWLAGKERNRGKRLSLSVLNKIEEKKRVFNDDGWVHYIKGRQWDRI